MNHRSRLLFFVLLSILVGCPGLIAGEEDEVHFCEDADGNILLQTDLCPEPVVPEPAPPPPPPVRTRPVAPKSKVVSAPVPARTTVLPKARRSTSGWMLIQRTPNTTPAPRSSLKRQVFPKSLVGAPRPTKPSFTSPEETWRAFITAVEGADRAGVGACFTPAALEQLGPDAQSIPLEELRTMLGMFTRIENGGDLGSFWSIYGVRSNQRPKWIFFEQTASGEWKIAGI